MSIAGEFWESGWAEEDETAWYVNEEGEVYEYSRVLQAEHYPNDYPVAYNTREEAEAASKRVSGWVITDLRWKTRHHQFTGNQQAEYNSLRAAGRTFYDAIRSLYDHEHDVAFAMAKEVHGLKSRP